MIRLVEATRNAPSRRTGNSGSNSGTSMDFSLILITWDLGTVSLISLTFELSMIIYHKYLQGKIPIYTS